MKPPHALSARQPSAELILRGPKKVESRGIPTRIRERVYLYASQTPRDQAAFDALGPEPGDLPTGVVAGTVEIVGCTEVPRDYRWRRARSKRLAWPVKPQAHPQPVWFCLFKPNDRKG